MSRIAIFEAPAVVERLADRGADATPMSREACRAFPEAVVGKFQTIVDKAGITIGWRARPSPALPTGGPGVGKGCHRT